MAQDIVITPASGKMEFFQTVGGSAVANIQLNSSTSDVTFSSTSGSLIIGDVSRDVYIGDGINSVDIVFEQSGEIRGLTNKTLTLGQSDSVVNFNTSKTTFSAGNVGVATTTPSYTLDVNGTIHYTTSTASSDARFKTNVQPIENALEKINKVRGVRFEWNEFVNNRRNGYELNKPTFGVLAQELEVEFPELVTTWQLSEDCQDARSVNYEKIVPILIEAIKELKAKNEVLESRVMQLENK